MRGVLAYLALSLVTYGFVYYGQFRYRLPMEPLMILVATPLLVRVWAQRARRCAACWPASARNPAGRRLTWLRRHPAAAAALIYAVLSVLLYAPALLPGHTLSASDYLWIAAPWSSERPADVRVFGSNYELVDSAVQFQPWLEYTRDRLPDAPLWNPYDRAGRPYLANAQSAILSPFSLPAYVLPFWWSLGVIAVLKVFAAAFGTYLLGRALGMRFGGALLAGLVFAFCLYFLVWVVLAADRTSGRWLPVADACSPSGSSAPRARCPWPAWRRWWRCSSSAATPSRTSTCSAATVVFFALPAGWCCAARARCRGCARRSLGFAAGLVGGAALAAITLVPFLELLFALRATWTCAQGSRQIALPQAVPARLRALRLLGPRHARRASGRSPRSAPSTPARSRSCSPPRR